MDLTNSSCTQEYSYWIKDLSLFPVDKESIVCGRWLTDAVITAGQKLLKQAHPHMGGLQPTILGLSLTFEVQRSEFVQVLHIGGNHWLTVSNIGCPHATVHIFDSLPNIDLPSCTKAQIAALLCTDKHQIQLEFQCVQLQHGSSDCGTFALAYAASLCTRKSPTQTIYIQNMLREHLLHGIETGVLTEFPQQRHKRKPVKQRGQVLFNVYCKCRQIENGEMIQCNNCGEWYDENCVDVLRDHDVWKKVETIWMCEACCFVIRTSYNCS